MHHLIIQHVANYILYYSLSPCLPAGPAATFGRRSKRTLLGKRPTVLLEVVVLLGGAVLLRRNPPTRLLVKVQILQLQTTLGHVCIAVAHLCSATPKVCVLLPCDVVHPVFLSRVTLHYEL